MKNRHKEFERKESVDEIIPDIIQGHLPIRMLIYEYASDGNSNWLKMPFTFFGIDSASIKVLALVRQAGSLDDLEKIIRKKPDFLLEVYSIDGMSGTLLQLAIIGLDRTVLKEEGMAERLIKLHLEFFPTHTVEVLKQVESATSIESFIDKHNREKTYYKLLVPIFESIKKYDHTALLIALNCFYKFISDNKPVVMTNNRYHLNLLYFLSDAFELLDKRSGELNDGWYGKQAKQFCDQVISVIEKALPSRAKQFLHSRLFQFFYEREEPRRKIDFDDSVSQTYCFYDDTGYISEAEFSSGMRSRPTPCFFKAYVERLDQVFQMPTLIPKSKSCTLL